MTKMEIKELPLRVMRTCISNPNQAGLEFLDNFGIPAYIKKKFPALEDMADAFDGAFTGYYLHMYLLAGEPEFDCIVEIYGWHEYEHQTDLQSPFYHGLRIALKSCGHENLYKKAIDFIGFSPNRQAV